MSLCDMYIDKERYEDTKRYVLSMLGYPQVKVEISDDQLKEAINSSLGIVANYMGKKRYAYTLTQMRVAEYDVPSDCHTVMRIYYNLPYMSAIGNVNTAMFSPFYMMSSNLATDIYESPVTFWAYMASREMITKIYGIWTDFEVIEGGERLRIYPTPLAHEDILCIFYRSTEINLDRDNFNFFKELTLAYSMRILGRIRSKYQSGLPSSGGNTMTLDGDKLLADAQSEIERIKEELRQRDPMEWSVF